MHFIIMSLCALPGKAVPKMTYTGLGRMLNPTHRLTYSLATLHLNSRV